MATLTEFLNKKSKHNWSLHRSQVPLKKNQRSNLLNQHVFPDYMCPENVLAVQQPFMWASFVLRSLEYKILKKKLEITTLYHDTHREHVRSIIATNLDWRRVVRRKYGPGVSFARNMEYAFKESNAGKKSENESTRRTLLIVDVLIGNEHKLNLQYKNVVKDDTVVSVNNKVIVKFRDDEFYPKYIIHYDEIYDDDDDDEDEYYDDYNTNGYAYNYSSSSSSY